MSENVNLCEYIESKCVHVEADCFDLEQIMESGQCFRIYKLSLQEQEYSFAAKRNTSSSGVITLIWILITAVMKRQLMRMTII